MDRPSSERRTAPDVARRQGPSLWGESTAGWNEGGPAEDSSRYPFPSLRVAGVLAGDGQPSPW